MPDLINKLMYTNTMQRMCLKTDKKNIQFLPKLHNYYDL